MPREAEVANMRLAPLGPDDLEEDFAAVTESCGKLHGLFGDDWPRGLTLRDDALDLAWHLKEFDLSRSFAWAIRDRRHYYLGCAYLVPEQGGRGTAEGWVWFRAGALSDAGETVAILAVQAWLRKTAPVQVRFPQNLL
ncbi:hypothetical protein [Chachezhania sediminis]|uniref:hypothetical protein n=1 Tax=Chachezhania sediminis TaxID=2599291 RepID=UPI001E539D0A|nr:hypothetical protein [Chachezhania sediminis]